MEWLTERWGLVLILVSSVLFLYKLWRTMTMDDYNNNSNNNNINNKKEEEEEEEEEEEGVYVVPKGSWGWPLIGETLEFIASGYTSRPVAFMEKRKSL